MVFFNNKWSFLIDIWGQIFYLHCFVAHPELLSVFLNAFLDPLRPLFGNLKYSIFASLLYIRVATAHHNQCSYFSMNFHFSSSCSLIFYLQIQVLYLGKIVTYLFQMKLSSPCILNSHRIFEIKKKSCSKKNNFEADLNRESRD